MVFCMVQLYIFYSYIAEDSSFAANIDSLGLPSKIRSVNNWTFNWTEKEDKQLLKSKFDSEEFA